MTYFTNTTSKQIVHWTSDNPDKQLVQNESITVVKSFLWGLFKKRDSKSIINVFKTDNSKKLGFK